MIRFGERQTGGETDRGRQIRQVPSECRFVANTIKEAFVHPRSLTVIGKGTGKVTQRNGKPVADNRHGNADRATTS